MRHWLRSRTRCCSLLALAAPAAAAPTVQEFPLPTASAAAAGHRRRGRREHVVHRASGSTRSAASAGAAPGTVRRVPAERRMAPLRTSSVGPDGNDLVHAAATTASAGSTRATRARTRLRRLRARNTPRGIAVGTRRQPLGRPTRAGPGTSGITPAGKRAGRRLALPARLQRPQHRPRPGRNIWVTDFALPRSRTSHPAPPARRAADGFDGPGGSRRWTSIARQRRQPLVHGARARLVGRITPAGVSATNFTSQGVDPFGITSVRTARSGSPSQANASAGRSRATRQVTGMTAGARPRVHRPGPKRHALVHREGREPGRPGHRHRCRSRHLRRLRRRLTQRSRTSRASGSPGRCSASVGSAR